MERDLDPEERRLFRQMILEWEFYKRAWALVRQIFYWAAGVAGAVYAIHEPLGKVLRALGS